MCPNRDLGTNAEFGQNSASGNSSAEINRLSSELNSRLSRELDEMVGSVNTQIQRAISDAISNQILPQIQTALNAGSGHVTQNRWNVPPERPEMNPEETYGEKTKKNTRCEQRFDCQNGSQPNLRAYDTLRAQKFSCVRFLMVHLLGQPKKRNAQKFLSSQSFKYLPTNAWRQLWTLLSIIRISIFPQKWKNFHMLKIRTKWLVKTSRLFVMVADLLSEWLAVNLTIFSALFTNNTIMKTLKFTPSSFFVHLVVIFWTLTTDMIFVQSLFWFPFELNWIKFRNFNSDEIP